MFKNSRWSICLYFVSMSALGPGVLALAQGLAPDLANVGAASEKALAELAETTIKQSRREVATILRNNPSKATFASTFGSYDRSKKATMETLHFIELVSLVSADEQRRNQAQALATRLRDSIRELYGTKMAPHLKRCAAHLKVEGEEAHLVKFVLDFLKHEGGDLSPKKRVQLQKLQAKISALSTEFDRNVQESSALKGSKAATRVEASQSDLQGVDPHLVASFERTSPKLLQVESNRPVTYFLGTDYPTVEGVLRYAKSVGLRKKVYEAFANRAYPQNYAVLGELQKTRQEAASLLGASSYAAWDLENQMAEGPNQVKQFLDSLAIPAKARATQEMDKIRRLATLADLNDQKQLLPWSTGYLQTLYQSKSLDLDLSRTAEYFPVNRTLAGLFEILQKQFGVVATLEKQVNVWDSSVLVASLTYNGVPRGQVYFDLYPRPGKYTHGRVSILRTGMKLKDGTIVPGQVAILTNFSKPSAGQQALFTYKELRTLFHEFGHAVHALLTETQYSFMDLGEMAMTYGSPVTTDFVELPSQFLEFWLKDPSVLVQLSGHFQTGERLSRKFAEALARQDELFKGIELVRTLSRAYLSLQLFESPLMPTSSSQAADQSSPFDGLTRALNQELLPFEAIDPNAHSVASFLHLTSYGAKYYSYLWTQVFAADLFSVFEEQGLLKSQELGRKYCAQVLSKGGSIPPRELLESFLGRPINPEHFLRQLK